MKGKVVTVDGSGDYYVLEDIDYKDKKYILCGKCDVDEETAINEDLLIFSVSLNGDDLVVSNVDDNDYDTVYDLLIEKASNEESN